jgi:hypothetical protein
MNHLPLRPAAEIGAVEDRFFTLRDFPLTDGTVNASMEGARGQKTIEVGRRGYNHELYRQSPVAVSAANLQRRLSSKL